MSNDDYHTDQTEYLTCDFCHQQVVVEVYPVHAYFCKESSKKRAFLFSDNNEYGLRSPSPGIFSSSDSSKLDDMSYMYHFI